jgi:hypothetical protein
MLNVIAKLGKIQKMIAKSLKVICPKLNLNRMVYGNFKLARSILIFDTTAGTAGTCSCDCKGCYAKKPQNRFPMTRLFRAVNTYLVKNNIELLEYLLVEQIKKSKKISAVRLHSSGDFCSQEYIDMWDRIIKQFPEIKFYTYTKVDRFDFTGIESNSNFNLIPSVVECDGKRVFNFGDEEHIEKLLSNGFFLCPATIKGVDEKGMCGNECKFCQTHKTVCFNIH